MSDKHTRQRNPFDPTEARAVDQSTQSEGGLGSREVARGEVPDDDDLIGRDRDSRDTTPRRYDHPDDNETALPSGDATLKTKI